MTKGTPTITVTPILFAHDGAPINDMFLVLKATNTKAVKPLQLISDTALAHFTKQHTTTILPTETSRRNDK